MVPLEIFGGSVLGVVFEKLYQAIADAVKKATGFDSSLKKLEETLKYIEPGIVKIKHYSDYSTTEGMRVLTQIIDDGETLIRNCSKVSCYNCWQKRSYAKTIEEFEERLTRWCQMYLPIQNYVNNLEILHTVKSTKSDSCAPENLGSCEAPKPPDFRVGLDPPLKELKSWLLKDEESMIVVSAPGGCGKTTLAKKLCHDRDVNEHFQHIFFVTVSKQKSYNLIRLIKKLFSAIGEKAPEFQSEEDAINQLQVSLKKIVESDRMLLVLDDVWSESKSLLFDFMSKISEILGVKILVTSRTGFKGFGRTYNLKLLDDKDARALFRNWAIPKESSSSSLPDDDLVNEIVKCCKGFPLVLEVLGRSLCGEPIETWRSRRMKLSEGQFIVNDEDKVRDCLQKSLDALDDKDVMLKEYFMDLGSFPEDHRIPATALIDMYAELHPIQHDHPIHAISNLHSLCSRNLLKLVVTRDDPNESVDFYNDVYVLQHDLLRDLAIIQCNQGPVEQRKRLILDLTGNRLPEWWTEEMQPLLRAQLVSISIDEMSSSWRNMQIPDAKVLVLNINQTGKEYKLPELMKQMDELRALIVTNYGFSSTELTNFSVLSSLSNLRRIRLERVSIPTLCNTTAELKNLEKISLVMCHKIDQSFAMSSIQITEMFPKLREINIDYCSDLELPKGFCHLVGLNKLSITNCHKLSALPEEIGNLENLEMLRVRACTSVSGLPESVASLGKLTVLDITGCFRMKNFPNGIGLVGSLREIHMRGCSKVCELPLSVGELVDLEKVICDEENASRWEFWKDCLPNLRLIVPEKVHSLSWL